jgi:hypothetical protein
VVQAYDATARSVVTVASKADPPLLLNPTLGDLADALTATPVFFPHVTLAPPSAPAARSTMAKGVSAPSVPPATPHVFIDASVVSGSALLPALAEARRLWPREDKLVVVVVGPGRPSRSIHVPAAGLGGPQWLQVRARAAMGGEHVVVANMRGGAGCSRTW